MYCPVVRMILFFGAIRNYYFPQFFNSYIVAIYHKGMYSFNVVKLFLSRSLEPIAGFAVNHKQKMT